MKNPTDINIDIDIDIDIASFIGLWSCYYIYLCMIHSLPSVAVAVAEGFLRQEQIMIDSYKKIDGCRSFFFFLFACFSCRL